MSDEMSAEPVAWILETRGYSGPEMPDEYDTHITTIDPKNERYTPLYSQSPAQARAMAIAEAAQACIDYANGIKEMSSRDASVAFECADIIRDMSSPPSVSEEWVRQIVLSANGGVETLEDANCRNAVRASLAALGIEVTK